MLGPKPDPRMFPCRSTIVICPECGVSYDGSSIEAQAEHQSTHEHEEAKAERRARWKPNKTRVLATQSHDDEGANQ